MRDTSPEVEAMYNEMLMSLPPGRKLAMAFDMFEAGKVLLLAGIRDKYGEQDELTEILMVFERMYRGELSPEEIEWYKNAIRTDYGERHRKDDETSDRS